MVTFIQIMKTFGLHYVQTELSISSVTVIYKPYEQLTQKLS